MNILGKGLTISDKDVLQPEGGGCGYGSVVEQKGMDRNILH